MGSLAYTLGVLDLFLPLKNSGTTRFSIACMLENIYTWRRSNSQKISKAKTSSVKRGALNLSSRLIETPYVLCTIQKS